MPPTGSLIWLPIFDLEKMNRTCIDRHVGNYMTQLIMISNTDFFTLFIRASPWHIYHGISYWWRLERLFKCNGESGLRANAIPASTLTTRVFLDSFLSAKFQGLLWIILTTSISRSRRTESVDTHSLIDLLGRCQMVRRPEYQLFIAEQNWIVKLNSKNIT